MARLPTKMAQDDIDRARRLSNLREATAQPAASNQRPNSSRPVVRNGAERAFDYLDIVDPLRQANDLVLSPSTAGTLVDVVQEYKNSEAIRRHNLPLRNRLLFYGPPGCGKSATAEVLAKEVGLPFLVAKLDTVIGSLLGETANNLKRIFDWMDRQQAVLFLDEFDALARTRNDPSEHSEMRRVVNSLLLMIERYRGRGFIVAATNLEATIDLAIIRRFDEVVYFGPPSSSEIRRLVQTLTRNFPVEFDIGARADELSGRSHADIERICFAAMRHAVMNARKKISETDFQYALSSDRKRRDLNRVIAPSS